MNLDTLFLVLFFLNVVIISLYFPDRITRTYRGALEKYPPTEFPKLYVGWPIEDWYQFLTRYRRITLAIAALGLVIVGALSFLGLPEPRSTIVIFCAFVVAQSGCNAWRVKMAQKSLAALQMDDISTHTAELRPRTVFACLSTPYKIAVVVSVLVCCYFLAQLAIHLSLGKALTMAVITLAISGLCVFNANKVVRGDVEIMQAMLPQSRNTLITRAVMTAADTIVRLNLFISVVAFFGATGNWHLLPAIISGAVLANTSYEFFRELQIRGEDFFDMDRFRASSTAGLLR